MHGRVKFLNFILSLLTQAPNLPVNRFTKQINLTGFNMTGTLVFNELTSRSLIQLIYCDWWKFNSIFRSIYCRCFFTYLFFRREDFTWEIVQNPPESTFDGDPSKNKKSSIKGLSSEFYKMFWIFYRPPSCGGLTALLKTLTFLCARCVVF